MRKLKQCFLFFYFHFYFYFLFIYFFFEFAEGVLHYPNFWNEVEPQLFEKLTTDPIKGEGKYIQGKLKGWSKQFSW